MSGLFSGLTIGLFSLSISDLETKIGIGDKRAKKIYSVRKNGNLLLTTLLLGNVGVNTTLSIYLGSVASGLIAGVLATSLIFLLGEILPQAIFSRYAMRFGYRFIWFIQIFWVLLYPITKPISILLDKLLGLERITILSKQELGEIIKKQEDEPNSPIDEDEERIILGALSFSEKKAIDILTPTTVSYYLNENTGINQTLLEEIKTRGFSRIPIYHNTPDNMVGILYVKDLINIDPHKGIIAGDIARKNKLFKVDESTKLDLLFNELIKRRTHLTLIFDEFGAFSGIVTLEDIVEEILSVEIVDEQDEITDLQKHAKDKQDIKNREKTVE